uniref:Putative secreted protein n=1 Tax=Anopheles darlingi TaxID=43151 RepID=A0A2M4DQW2_ANODA
MSVAASRRFRALFSNHGSHCWAAWLMMAIHRLAASSVSADSCTFTPSSVSIVKLNGRLPGSIGLRQIL